MRGCVVWGPTLDFALFALLGSAEARGEPYRLVRAGRAAGGGVERLVEKSGLA